MNTEITDTNVTELNGSVPFDGNCSLCIASARFFRRTLYRYGFPLAPLQAPWVRERLGLAEKEPCSETKLLLTNGNTSGGAGAFVEIAKRICWGRLLYGLAHLPCARPVLEFVYRIIAANRYCANRARNLRPKIRRIDWLPLLVLATVILALQSQMAGWAFMWTLAAAILAGCKWLMFRRALLSGLRPTGWRLAAYFLAWPGMDATEFLAARKLDANRPSKRQWLFSISKTLAGVALVWFAARGAFGSAPLVTGWMGMLGTVLFLHFGLFQIVSLGWQAAGVNAKPIMRAPLFATSLSEFWSTRWNTAFNCLAHELAFRPLTRRIGVARATLGVFLISGLVHDLVVSLPAKAGFGLPTAYFLFQGVGVLAERSALGRRIGLGKGFRGWVYTVVCAGAPAFWLFHPPFIKDVILPMLHTIAQIERTIP